MQIPLEILGLKRPARALVKARVLARAVHATGHTGAGTESDGEVVRWEVRQRREVMRRCSVRRLLMLLMLVLVLMMPLRLEELRIVHLCRSVLSPACTCTKDAKGFCAVQSTTRSDTPFTRGLIARPAFRVKD